MVKILLTVVIIIFSALSVIRTESWHNDILLWSDSKSKSPGQARVRSNLALALYRTGDYRLAYKEAVATTKLYYYHPDSHYIVGDILLKNGDYKKAEKAMKWASMLNEKYTRNLRLQGDIHFALYEIYSRNGNIDLADLQYQKALDFGYKK